MGSFSNEQKKYLGSIKVTVKTPDFRIPSQNLKREFRRVMRQAHEEGLNDGIRILKDVLDEKGINASGRLSNSVARKLFVRTTDIFEGTVHFNNPGKQYAWFVEHGRRGYPDEPHRFPPYKAIMQWGESKGLSSAKSYFTWLKIGREGYEGKPFMEEAERRITENYSNIVDRAVEKFRMSRNL